MRYEKSNSEIIGTATTASIGPTTAKIYLVYPRSNQRCRRYNYYDYCYYGRWSSCECDCLFIFSHFVLDVPFCRRRYLFIRSMGKLCVKIVSVQINGMDCVCGVRAPRLGVCDCTVWYNVSAYLNSLYFWCELVIV